MKSYKPNVVRKLLSYFLDIYYYFSISEKNRPIKIGASSKVFYGCLFCLKTAYLLSLKNENESIIVNLPGTNNGN